MRLNRQRFNKYWSVYLVALSTGVTLAIASRQIGVSGVATAIWSAGIALGALAIGFYFGVERRRNEHHDGEDDKIDRN